MNEVDTIPASEKQMAFGRWGSDEYLELGMLALKKYQESGKRGKRKTAGHRSLHLALCEAYVDGEIEL